MEQILLSPKELNRYEMVQARLKAGNKIEKILSDYTVSRRSFYVNLHKFERKGIEGLKSKWGIHRKINENTEERFIKLFKEHPYFSSYEFSEIINLNPRTIQRMVIRHKLIKSYKPKKERLHILENIKKTKSRAETKKTRAKNLRRRKTKNKRDEEKTP